MTEHHAIVCIAQTLDTDTIPDAYKKQSEDVSHIISDRFSIDQARQLLQDAQQKPVIGEYRTFVIVTKKLPVETQNALLKLFEEPPQQTRFYLVIPQEGLLIPTLRSRVLIQYERDTEYIQSDVYTQFLDWSYAERLTYIADITKKKDLESIELLLEGAEQYVAKKPLTHTQTLESIVFIRRYARTQGASAKMLLEELALSLPVVN